MNRDLLKLFFIIVLSLPTLGQANSDDSKYIKLLPEGRLRDYYESSPEETDSRFFARVIWSAVYEKNRTSMSKAQRLAYEIITQFFLREYIDNKNSLSLCNWRNENYKLLRTAAFETALKMKLSAEQTHEEVTKVVEMCIKLEQEIEMCIENEVIC